MPARWFRIVYAENAFRRLLAADGQTLDELRLPSALALWAAFYRDHRAQHARIEEGGDVLAWHWGPVEDADRIAVELRRRMTRDDGSQPPVELRLGLHYRATARRRALGSGGLTCTDPAQLRDAVAAIRSSAAYRGLASAAPTAVVLGSGTARPR